MTGLSLLLGAIAPGVLLGGLLRLLASALGGR